MSDYLALWRYWQQGARAFARDDYRLYSQSQQRLAQYLGSPVTGRRILDVGCGQHYPETLLYQSNGNAVTGIDLDVVGVGVSWRKYRAIARQNGIKRAAKSLVREFAFDPVYFSELEKSAGRPLRRRGLDLRSADATALPFVGGTFDLVVSTAAFEHIADVDKAVSEIARVLKPGGLAHIDIHLFTSLSGGHHLEWTWPDHDVRRSVPPWDHLRQNLYPVDYYLNRQRESAYRASFERHMSVMQWVRGRSEGERRLTPELRKELSAYSEDELLRRNVIVIATQRS